VFYDLPRQPLDKNAAKSTTVGTVTWWQPPKQIKRSHKWVKGGKVKGEPHTDTQRRRQNNKVDKGGR